MVHQGLGGLGFGERWGVAADGHTAKNRLQTPKAFEDGFYSMNFHLNKSAIKTTGMEQS